MRIGGRDLVGVKLVEDSMRNWHAKLEFATPRGLDVVDIRVLEPECLGAIGRLGVLGDIILDRKGKLPV